MKKKTMIELQRVGAEEYRQLAKIPLVVVLDDVRSLNNIGSVFRTSDAFRVEKIYLSGITATPPDPDIHKTALSLGSMSTILCRLCSVSKTMDILFVLSSKSMVVRILRNTA